MIVMRVNSYEEYRSIIKSKTLINNGFLPNEIKKYILQNRLFYSQDGNRIFFFYDEKKYRQLICGGFESCDNRTIAFELLKPFVCHLVENNKNTGMIGEMQKVLQSSGFQLRCIIHEYVLDNLTCLPVSINKNFIISNEIGINSEYQIILSLWQNNLPLYEVTHMTLEDIQALAEKNQILYLKDSITGVIAGACFYDILLGSTTIHHIVVDPAFRGKGCAGILLTAWLEQAKQLGAKTARSWIEDTNLASQKSFSKVGFKRTLNLSYQYVKV